MKRNLITVFALIAVLLSSCEEKPKNANKAMASVETSNTVAKIAPDEFAKKMYEANALEVKLGTLAQKKASNADVKEFANLMVKDHTEAKDAIKKMAMEKNIMVPEMSDEKQSKITSLEKKSGMDFDKTYMDMMVKDHKKDADYLQKAIKDLEDPEFKEYAKNMLSTVMMHEQKAEDISQNLEVSAKANY